MLLVSFLCCVNWAYLYGRVSGQLKKLLKIKYMCTILLKKVELDFYCMILIVPHFSHHHPQL